MEANIDGKNGESKFHMNFMNESEHTSLRFLDGVLSKIRPQLNLLLTQKELLIQAIRAGETDFQSPKRMR